MTAAEAQERRLPMLRTRRELKMSRDAHAYVRGSTAQFYDWVFNAEHSIPEGPRIWICGDAHVGNLGPIANTASHVEVELRDLDQTVPGNPAHDLVRLALSLAMAARSSALPGVVTARVLEALTAGYLSAFEGGDGAAAPAESASVRFIVREALRRKWRDLHRARLGKKPRFVLGSRFLALVEEERTELQRFLDEERLRTLMGLRDFGGRLRVVDTAYWVKGCSSLGLWRCAALVEISDGRGKKSKVRASRLLDIKEGDRVVSLPEDTPGVPRHQGQRVVLGARALSPGLGYRMVYGTIAGHEVFARELMPQDLKVELPLLDDVEARATAHALASIVGRAHSRQLDSAQCREWAATLRKAETRSLDAPGWLWSSVVALIGIHERAYLEHCRRYALAGEKARDEADTAAA
jgi:uncharacterized protein (DUF2252 family)